MLLLATFEIHSQVKIGDLNEPATGTLLDLNSVLKGALTLSNVNIADIEKIPTDNPNIFMGITAGKNDDVNEEFTGAIVYNSNAALPDGEGVYVWNGKRWDCLCRLKFFR
jgi:hypothetical protein